MAKYVYAAKDGSGDIEGQSFGTLEEAVAWGKANKVDPKLFNIEEISGTTAESLRAAGSPEVMQKKIQEGSRQQIEQEYPALSMAFPYSAQEPGSIKAGAMDIVTMPGRAVSAAINGSLDAMKTVSEEHAKQGNPFQAYLTSPATGGAVAGAIGALTLPVSGPVALLASAGLPAVGALAGQQAEAGDVGASDIALEAALASIGAAIPVVGGAISRAAVVRALVEKGIAPTKEVVAKAMRYINRSLSMKSAGKKMGAEYAGELAKDTRVAFPSRMPEKGEAIGQIRSGMSGKMTAQQAMANEQRMNSLYQKLDYIDKNFMDNMSPESLSGTVKELLIEYGDMPEAVEVIRKMFSKTYTDPYTEAIMGAAGKVYAPANPASWEGIAPGFATGKAMEAGLQAPILPKRALAAIPAGLGGTLGEVGPYSALRSSQVLYPIPATLGQLYGPNEDQVP